LLKKNTTIILTTHDTGDIKALAERILLIGKGKILMDGSIDDLNKITEKNGGTLDDTIAELYNKYGVA
jgi:ABC-2 type transport system ATP-binding protein